MTLTSFVERAAQGLELMGVLSIVVGAVVSLALAALGTWRRIGGAYQTFRQDLGRSILLGLELLVGADIIRTVSHDPTLRGIAVLGGVVVIRTLLSFTLEVELEGRWPWQRRNAEGSP